MNKNYAIKQTEENTWVVLDENEKGQHIVFMKYQINQTEVES